VLLHGKNTTCRAGRHHDPTVEKRTGTKGKRKVIRRQEQRQTSKKSVQYIIIYRIQKKISMRV